jgi:uncharacterized protein (DUF302 family)
MALPCRISVYTDQGCTRIGLIPPSDLLEGLSKDPALLPIAREVETALIQMVDKAR